jgi:gluconolactonase
MRKRTVIRRREFLGSAAGICAVSAKLMGQKADDPPTRYPDKNIVVLDQRFAKYRIANTPIQRLHTGMLWAEGPAWSGVGNYLSGALFRTTFNTDGSARTATSAFFERTYQQ